MFRLTLILLGSVFSVGALAQTDIQVKGKAPHPYQQVPIKHAGPASLKAEVINLGAEVTTDVSVTVTDNVQSFSGARQVMAPFASADTQLVEFDAFTPVLGKHTAIFQATTANDSDLSNNTDTVNYEVTTGTFCYTNFDTSRATGTYPWTDYMSVRQTYMSYSDDTIINFDVYLINPVIGAKFSVIVAFPNTSRFHNTKSYTNTDTLTKVVRLSFMSNLHAPIPPGLFTISLNGLREDLGLAVTTDNFQPGTTSVRNDVDFTYDPIESYPNRRFNPYVRAITKDGVLGVNRTNKPNPVNIYPNPTADLLNLEYSKPVVVEVYNYFGQKVDEFNFVGSHQYSMSKHATGTYLFRLLENGQQVAIKKITKL